ncbi:MAG: L-fucose isomerase [Caldilineaceae bacterium]|nr:L-fucose isomerase [Caldilineaceae bacterium]MBP8106454.1 L-fucose isomerase [Caldilineaceae bacterium]MBP8122685.1 L-fucose isomerase [Caldilineaceae bacterium]MBP9072017.1 L-fucose isomerase [Caldilineaceae bacterium]
MSDFKKDAPVNKLIGDMPKIGIRPTIDGRLGGVRESLEVQTMDMAKATAAFLSANLRHYNGLPVECVIADSTIGGVAEAARCADKFRREGVGVSLTVTPCWCYGSETMDMDPHLPKAIWGFNGTERPGAVYLAAVSAAHNQKGLPVFNIYGRDVQESGDNDIPADVQTKLLTFARAGLAVANMRGKSYLSMGGTSMGIGGSIVDQGFFQDYLGMRVEVIDMVEFVRRVEEGIFDAEEFELAMSWVREKCIEGDDYNDDAHKRTRAQQDEDWAISVKMALIARDLMIGNPKLAEIGFGEESLGRNAIASGFQGQRQWTDHLPNGDFMEAILNTSFDWNGIRQPYIVATENDALNGVSMLFNNLLTNTAQIFADVRTYWSPDAVERVTGHKLSGVAADGFLHLINSGPAALDGTGQQSLNGQPAMKPFWEITSEEADACLAATTWHTGMTEYFRGGGWSTRFRTKGGMPVTMCRVNLIKGLGPAMQIAEGWTIELPDDVHDVLDQRTNPTWPTTWFVPRTTGSGPFRDVYTVMNNWGANHGAISYGHIGGDLAALCALLRIPVYMHNIPEEQIFRPSAWAAFGANEPMGADFRACQNYGPLYG